jgi:hypothetical protein
MRILPIILLLFLGITLTGCSIPKQKSPELPLPSSMEIIELNTKIKKITTEPTPIQQIISLMSQFPDERGPVACPQTTGSQYNINFYNKDNQIVFRLMAKDFGCKLVDQFREKKDSKLLDYPMGGDRTWDNEAGKTFWDTIHSLLIN